MGASPWRPHLSIAPVYKDPTSHRVANLYSGLLSLLTDSRFLLLKVSLVSLSRHVRVFTPGLSRVLSFRIPAVMRSWVYLVRRAEGQMVHHV